MLMSINGVGNLVGRFLFGAVADLPRVDCVLLFIATLTTCGVGTCLAPLCGTDYTWHAVYMAFFGTFMGSSFCHSADSLLSFCVCCYCIYSLES